MGSVALMPNEKDPVAVRGGGEEFSAPLYPVEARSWGGHSGSPAFVYLGAERGAESISTGMVGLLGVLGGHFDIQADHTFTGDSQPSGTVPVNAGVAWVVPAARILELLMRDEFVSDREECRQVWERERPAATIDAG